MIKKEELIKQAEKFIRQNSLTQAIEIYSDIVKLYPKDLTAINALGDLQVRINNIEAAKEIFSHLAKEYSNQGFYEIAIAIYKKLLKLSNDSIAIGTQQIFLIYCTVLSLILKKVL
ncbi:MAG: tetratricopeptide repeat protein [Acidobacteria bacterium]|nr:tetratricopeptide repeat protein [Acidobacteriota bacterium]